MSDNSAERPAEDKDPRDHLEGYYTEVEGEPERERSVRGEYTRTERGGPDPDHMGAYTDSVHEHGDAPSPHSSHDRRGKYTRHDE